MNHRRINILFHHLKFLNNFVKTVFYWTFILGPGFTVFTLFLIAISLQPNVIDLRYFNLWVLLFSGPYGEDTRCPTTNWIICKELLLTSLIFSDNLPEGFTSPRPSLNKRHIVQTNRPESCWKVRAKRFNF